MRLTPADGPADPSGSTPHVGLFPGSPVLRFEFGDAGSQRLVEPFTVEPDSFYRVGLYPELLFEDAEPDPLPVYSSAAIGIVGVTESGERLELRDQHHLVIREGEPGPRVTDQWNLIDLDLRDLAGQQISIELTSPEGQRGSGWVQPIGPLPAPNPHVSPIELVHTTRGTHQTGGGSISRGNTFPLTCVPHGFNFLTPITDARSHRWLYSWHGRPTDPDPRPALQALAVSHCPSPWMGDRTAFQLMSWTGHPTIDPLARERHFDHDDELDQPHHYRVRLEDGVVAEMVPTCRTGLFRFDFSDAHAERRGVLFDQPGGGDLELTRLHDGRIAFTARIDPPADWQLDRLPTLPGYVYGETRQPVDIVDASTREGIPELPTNLGRAITRGWPRWARLKVRRPQAAAVQLREGEVLEVALAVSFISTEQARHTLTEELGSTGFDQVREDAARQWTDILDRLEITGGTHDQRVSAYSNLARLHAWPNAHHENLSRTPGEQDWGYASPFRPLVADEQKHRTGAEVVPGRLQVNNGYWDTFRTCWPAFHLFTPKLASELLDGILQQYQDGGWMARWSAPGYCDIMVGTSSDAIFSDANSHGVSFNEVDAYDSALRNACVPSEQTATGRKGIARARFRSYVDTDVHEGFSWSMDNANSDAAIAAWSTRLANKSADALSPTTQAQPDRIDEFRANAVWFRHRASGYQQLFDRATGFFRARRPDGRFRESVDDFDPSLWGRDYTEATAWGMAFHAPFDAEGLAELYGGEDELAAKLEQALSTPESASGRVGRHYGGVIHEMTEARALRLGQVAMSNQPAHHIPYMFTVAGHHHRTQWLTREILERCFTGSAIGQGYPGDEDNGEMSAWWLLSAAGLYPLSVGSGEMVITAPLFERFAFRRDDDTLLEVTAGNIHHRYIQWVTVNGEGWDHVTIPTWMLHDGDLHLHVELGPEPSDWARDTRPVSLGGQLQGHRWHDDLTGRATISPKGARGLIDDEGEGASLAAGDVVELEWPETVTASIYTLTPRADGTPPVLVEYRTENGEWHRAHSQPRQAKWADQSQAYLLHISGEALDLTALRLSAREDVDLVQVELYL